MGSFHWSAFPSFIIPLEFNMMDTNMVPPTREVPLPLYHGGRSATAVTAWVTVLERFAKTYTWNEATLINNAALHLRDSAANWYVTFERSVTPMTWTLLSEGLVDAFRPTLSRRPDSNWFRWLLH